MASVMYTPNPGNSGRSNNSSRSRSTASAQQIENTRTIAGLFATGCVLFFSFAAFQFVGIVLGGLEPFGALAILVISVGSLTFTALSIFKTVSGGGVRVITVLSIGCFLSGWLVPGLPALVGLVCVGANFCILAYRGAYATIRSPILAVELSHYPGWGAFLCPIEHRRHRPHDAIRSSSIA